MLGGGVEGVFIWKKMVHFSYAAEGEVLNYKNIMGYWILVGGRVIRYVHNHGYVHMILTL
jgi:hypothetical protein